MISNPHISCAASGSTMPAKSAVVKRAGLAVASSLLFLLIAGINSYTQVKPSGARSSLVFSTYFGGGKGNWREQTYGAGIAVDKQGYVYITGRTQARDFPSVNPVQKRHGGGENDAFIAKLTPDGQKLVYSTVLGGGDADFAERIAVDDSGNAYIAGTTYSRNFPTTPQAAQRSFGGGDRDGFAAKFSADGKLVYATLLGGDETDRCTAIDVDGAGNAYVTGSTNSSKFAALTGTPSEHPRKDWDVLVAKLDPSGSKFTYVFRFGGTAGDAPRRGGFGGEAGAGIKISCSNTVYVVGYTDSEDFPIRNSLQYKFGGRSDGFIARLGAADAELQASTYLGGAGNDRISAVALDALGNVSVTGKTEPVDAPNPGDRITQISATSGDFPMHNALQPKRTAFLGSAFVTRLNADLTEMEYSTYLNCGANDNGADITVDGLGNTYIIGSSNVPRYLPLVNPILLPQPAEFLPAFVIELAPDGRRIAFSTLLGNPFSNQGAGIAVDSIGDIYVIGTTGYGGGVNKTADFPTVRAFQPERINKSFQAFISKITIR
jgi:hypothetical protein